MKLGNQVSVPDKPDAKTLETFKTPGVDYVTFKTKEFTSLCPVTGQPDFAEIEIEYTPDKLCLESKSLKLYLQSYRNERGFIEQLCCKIHNDLRETLNPIFVGITIKSVPRGGVALEAEKNSYRGSDET